MPRPLFLCARQGALPSVGSCVVSHAGALGAFKALSFRLARTSVFPSVMTIPAILQQLAMLPDGDCDYAPYERAMLAAREQRDAIIPALVTAVERVADNPAHYQDHPEETLFLFALVLLAEFQATEAADAVFRFFSIPDLDALDRNGDFISDKGAAILASVSGGSPDRLRRLVATPGVSPDAVSQAIRALVVQRLWEERSQDEVVADFRELFAHSTLPDHPEVWSGLVQSAYMLRAPELKEDLRAAYQQGRVSPSEGFVGLTADQALIADPFMVPNFKQSAAPIDAIDVTSMWLCFWEDEAEDFLEEDTSGDLDESEMERLTGDGPAESPEFSPGWAEELDPKPTPFVAPAKVGRNDPCPCGSGRKYKKCCLK